MGGLSAAANASPLQGSEPGGGQGRGGAENVPRPPTKEWLDLVIETPIEPEIPIIDAHHHMSYAPGPSRYNLEDILADTKRNNIRQTVCVIGFASRYFTRSTRRGTNGGKAHV